MRDLNKKIHGPSRFVDNVTPVIRQAWEGTSEVGGLIYPILAAVTVEMDRAWISLAVHPSGKIGK